ncbi:hypothetical protein D3C81_1051710 [compost metagenome]
MGILMRKIRRQLSCIQDWSGSNPPSSWPMTEATPAILPYIPNAIDRFVASSKSKVINAMPCGTIIPELIPWSSLPINKK